MIFRFVYLFLFIEYITSEEIDIVSNGRVIHLSQTKNRNRTTPTLRINFGRQNDKEKWDHISDKLVKFLECTGPAASHIPPITIGKYKSIVKNCLGEGNSLEQLRNDSIDALKKEVPEEAEPIFECLSNKIYLKGEDSDQNGHIAQIIECLNRGDALKAAVIMSAGEKNVPAVKSDEEFAEAFHKCILQSNRNTYEAKVMHCMDTYKSNNDGFYTKFNPLTIRTHKDDQKKKESNVRVSYAKKSPKLLALIIVDSERKNNGKRNRVYSKKTYGSEIDNTLPKYINQLVSELEN